MYAFIWEWARASKYCDGDALESRIQPGALLTFEVPGEPPEVMSSDEYMTFFRKECLYTRWGSFDKSSMSVTVNGDQATVKGRWEGGTLIQYFFSGHPIKAVEETQILVRDGDNILLASLHEIAVPDVGKDAAP